MFNNNTPFTMPVVPSGNNSAFGNGTDSWLWIIVVFALLFGWGNGGFGGFGGSGAQMNYVLSSDFATLQRQLSDGFGATESKLDSISNGICSLGYDQLSQMNGINTNIMQGTNAIQTQLADCCCRTQQNIKDVDYNIATTGANITNAIKDCCCEERSQFADLKYTMATENCATRQAIADSTKQIIDYMSNEKLQTLRDENQALKLSASQACQNNTIINALRPFPVPSFNVGYNPYSYGFNGTTIA